MPPKAQCERISASKQNLNQTGVTTRVRGSTTSWAIARARDEWEADNNDKHVRGRHDGGGAKEEMWKANKQITTTAMQREQTPKRERGRRIAQIKQREFTASFCRFPPKFSLSRKLFFLLLITSLSTRFISIECVRRKAFSLSFRYSDCVPLKKLSRSVQADNEKKNFSHFSAKFSCYCYLPWRSRRG